MSSARRKERKRAMQGPEIGRRQPSPSNPPREDGVPAMVVRRSVVTLVRIDSTGWARTPELDKPTETCTLTAVLSDGTTVERAATVTYAEGEREKILEAVLRGNGTQAEVLAAQRVLYRRAQAVQKIRGELQREFA